MTTLYLSLFRIIFLASMLFANSLSAAPSSSGGSSFLDEFGSEDEVLSPDKAFKLELNAKDATTVEAHFTVAPHHYLYKERIKFETESGIESIALPKGDPKQDPNFGMTEVYHQDFDAIIHLKAPAPSTLTIKATYQGCSEKGLCYAPIKKTLELGLPEASSTSAKSNTSQSEAFSDDDEAAKLLKGGNLPLIIGGFFVFGLLLSLTPCVLPMIPILSGIIVGGKKSGRLHTFNLSLAYTLGMALSYTLAGIAAAFSGQLISNLLQNAWALGFGGLVFAVLALSMFGFYELQLPSSIESKMVNVTNRIKGGHFLGVFLMGALSALIVSPCVAAPLAGALLYISQSHDVVLGGAALFSLSIGMGVPLLLIGASAGSLLPKTGAWMNSVRNFFGVVMLGMAIWIIGPVIPASVQMVLWAALLIVPAIYMHAIDPLPAHAHGWARFWKGVAIIMLVYGVCILVGANLGAKSPLQPLAPLNLNDAKNHASTLNFKRVRSVAELDDAIHEAKGKTVMLDFYADWCVACKEMEANTFSDSQVQKSLQNTVLLQADVTENNADDAALLKRFGLFGPPGIIFFDAQGQEMPLLKVIGYQEPAKFLTTSSKL